MFVSVAHEAFLVNWPPLKDEIDAQQTALRARRVVENEAADWVAGGRETGLLLQAGKLTKATVDTGAELEPVRDSAGARPLGRSGGSGYRGWDPASVGWSPAWNSTTPAGNSSKPASAAIDPAGVAE